MGREGGGGVAARISEISVTKNLESDFFYKESKSNKKKNNKKKKLENLFMKHYASNHMLAPKKGSSQKEVQLKP